MLKSIAPNHSRLVRCQWDNTLWLGAGLNSHACVNRGDGVPKYSYDNSSGFAWSIFREYAEEESLLDTGTWLPSHSLSMMTQYTKETLQ